MNKKKITETHSTRNLMKMLLSKTMPIIRRTQFYGFHCKVLFTRADRETESVREREKYEPIEKKNEKKNMKYCEILSLLALI